MPKRAPERPTPPQRGSGKGEIPAAIEGSASVAYAARFAQRYAADFYRSGLAGSTVASIGVGTYLGECTEADDAAYEDAIAAAIDQGVNLIDTAINYRCQRSERAVGRAVQRCIKNGTPRDAILVCTKGGYLPLSDHPPESREEYRVYLKREFYDTGILTPDDVVSGGHSLAPSFLRYSIARSRKNLGLGTIDLYYLHNPEQQLAAMTHASVRERLRAAFMVLEDAVSRGDIRGYGCATWTGLRVPPTSKGHLSLQELVTLAREIAGERHHLRAVQMPINLGMPEAVRLETQTVGKTDTLVPALDAAVALGLSVVASASLMQAQLTHDLPPSMRELFPSQRTDAQRALSFVRSLPGITTALVGMRSIPHLTENLESAEPAERSARH
jgi:aryl-alcohol dehydrogenase-like predicted oxidoreductase